MTILISLVQHYYTVIALRDEMRVTHFDDVIHARCLVFIDVPLHASRLRAAHEFSHQRASTIQPSNSAHEETFEDVMHISVPVSGVESQEHVHNHSPLTHSRDNIILVPVAMYRSESHRKMEQKLKSAKLKQEKT